MADGTCTPPCYEEEDDCNLTIVKIFLGKHLESKTDPPVLYPLEPIMWHGQCSTDVFDWIEPAWSVRRQRSTERSDESNGSIRTYLSAGFHFHQRLQWHRITDLMCISDLQHSLSNTSVRRENRSVHCFFKGHFRFRYIRMSSPSLNNIILGGCVFAYISILLMGINSSLFPEKFSTDLLMNIICPVGSPIEQSSRKTTRDFV